MDYAFLARYLHQPIDALLGRTPTRDERRLLARAGMFWLEIDRQDPNG